MQSTTTASIHIATVPWDRGAGSGRVAAGYIQTVGLRPEDCFGIVPAHRGAGELLFVYRDSPERRDSSRATVDPDPAPVFCHQLQWPGVSRVEGFGSPSEYFSFYSRVVGLRPEDCFGWVPDEWNPHGQDSSHWEEFHLVYRDRPEYREGRARLWALGGLHEVGESAGFGGVPAPPLAGPPMAASATKSEWPRRRLLRVRGDDLHTHLGALTANVAAAPGHCFGIGVDRWSDHTWTVTATPI